VNSDLVYVIGAPGGSVAKIGHAKHLRRRLSQIQTGHPAKIEVLWSIEGGIRLESGLHDDLHEYRVHGEWFDFGTLDPVATVKEAVKRVRQREVAMLTNRTAPLPPAEVLASLRNARRLSDEAAAGLDARMRSVTDSEMAIDLAIEYVRHLTESAALDAEIAQASAMVRAEGVARTVDLCDGNQSKAARRLGLDQSTVNRLVRKARGE
jgi:hypothetical protein